MAIQGPIAGKIHVESFNTVYGIYSDSKTKELLRIVVPHDSRSRCRHRRLTGSARLQHAMTVSPSS
jgi:hypothetical protein